ncbi:hypothetical protein BDZ97DRAFT_1752936 [Flammula alnicola]|nr:hypothetical protein BDZ97DRAFT_1752936 [Flammula alnicola]
MDSGIFNSIFTTQPLADTWNGWHVTAANPDFDFVSSLRDSIDREHLAEDADLFSLSPLTSPEPTPPPSPQLAPITLPDINFEPLPPNAGSSSTQSKPTPKDRKARRKSSSRAARQKKRDGARESTYGHYHVRKKVQERYINNAEAIECDVEMEKADVTSTAYTAKDDGARSRKIFQLDEVVGENSKYNFKPVSWNGVDAIPIKDESGNLVTLLAGCPNDSNWPALQAQASRALEERRHRCSIPKDKRIHRRGAFTALATGVSHGGGQKEPRNLSNEGPNGLVVQELNEMEAFKRMGGFASAVMASWMPDLYRYYADNLGELHDKNPTLRRVWNCSIFSAATYNFGPRTCCFKHRDFGNLPFGWCAVTALGNYDPTKGGHLILWDLHLVIEFPPGSTILLPSAIVAHSNVAISKGETRYSFAQYSAGALFRWVDNKHQRAADYYASLTPEELAEVEVKNKARWKLGLSLWPVLKKKGHELS